MGATRIHNETSRLRCRVFTGLGQRLFLILKNVTSFIRPEKRLGKGNGGDVISEWNFFKYSNEVSTPSDDVMSK